MSTLSERIQQALEARPQVTKAMIARACKIKPASVSDWASGKTKSVSSAHLHAAAAALSVSPVWLATGEGPMDEQSVTEPAVVYEVRREVSLQARLIAVLEEMKLLPDEIESLVADAVKASERSQRVLATFGKLHLPAPTTAAQTDHIPVAPQLPLGDRRRFGLGLSTTYENGRRVSDRNDSEQGEQKK